MPIVKYAPFADTEDFPTGLRLFQDSINRLLSEDGVKTRPWAPAVDILETENELVLKADVPGVESEGHRHPARERHPDREGRAEV